MNNWVVGIIALVVGAIAGYFYGQRDVGALTDQVATLESQVSDAADKATAAAEEGMDALKAQIADLEAKLKDAMSPEAPAEEAPAAEETPAEEAPATEEEPAAQ